MSRRELEGAEWSLWQGKHCFGNECVTCADVLAAVPERARTGEWMLHGSEHAPFRAVLSTSAIATSTWLYFLAPYVQTLFLLAMDAASVRPFMASTAVTLIFAFVSTPRATRAHALHRVALLSRILAKLLPHLFFFCVVLVLCYAYPPLLRHLPRSPSVFIMLERAVPATLTARVTLPSARTRESSMLTLKHWTQFWTSSSLVLPVLRLAQTLSAQSEWLSNRCIAPLRLVLALWLVLPSPGGASALMNLCIRPLVYARELKLYYWAMHCTRDMFRTCSAVLGPLIGKRTDLLLAIAVAFAAFILMLPSFLREPLMVLVTDVFPAIYSIDCLDSSTNEQITYLRAICQYWSLSALVSLVHSLLSYTGIETHVPLYNILRLSLVCLLAASDHKELLYGSFDRFASFVKLR